MSDRFVTSTGCTVKVVNAGSAYPTNDEFKTNGGVILSLDMHQPGDQRHADVYLRPYEANMLDQILVPELIAAELAFRVKLLSEVDQLKNEKAEIDSKFDKIVVDKLVLVRDNKNLISEVEHLRRVHSTLTRDGVMYKRGYKDAEKKIKKIKKKAYNRGWQDAVETGDI